MQLRQTADDARWHRGEVMVVAEVQIGNILDAFEGVFRDVCDVVVTQIQPSELRQFERNAADVCDFVLTQLKVHQRVLQPNKHLCVQNRQRISRQVEVQQVLEHLEAPAGQFANDISAQRHVTNVFGLNRA